MPSSPGPYLPDVPKALRPDDFRFILRRAIDIASWIRGIHGRGWRHPAVDATLCNEAVRRLEVVLREDDVLGVADAELLTAVADLAVAVEPKAFADDAAQIARDCRSPYVKPLLGARVQ
jgi:hypothetical protein